MFRNVLVGVNGEEGGRDAIALARMLVTPDRELTVAHVFGSEPHELRGWSSPPMSDNREHAREVLERACTEADLEAHKRWHAASSVGRELHELAEITEADLLVVGRPSSSARPQTPGPTDRGSAAVAPPVPGRARCRVIRGRAAVGREGRARHQRSPGWTDRCAASGARSQVPHRAAPTSVARAERPIRLRPTPDCDRVSVARPARSGPSAEPRIR